MINLRILLAILAAALSLASAAFADDTCAPVGQECIPNDAHTQQLRIGPQTPSLNALPALQNLQDLTLIAELHYEMPVDLTPLAALPNLEKLALVGHPCGGSVTAAAIAQAETPQS